MGAIRSKAQLIYQSLKLINVVKSQLITNHVSHTWTTLIFQESIKIDHTTIHKSPNLTVWGFARNWCELDEAFDIGMVAKQTTLDISGGLSGLRLASYRFA